jgi:hypothetical protein
VLLLNECLLFISLSTQSGNFWIHPRTNPQQRTGICTKLYPSYWFIISVRVATVILFATASRPTPRPTHPPIQWVQGAISPRIKRSEHEADHSPPSSTDLVQRLRMRGAIPPLPICLYGVVLSYARGQLKEKASFVSSFQNFLLKNVNQWNQSGGSSK